jgi:hypothetical protein
MLGRATRQLAVAGRLKIGKQLLLLENFASSDFGFAGVC